MRQDKPAIIAALLISIVSVTILFLLEYGKIDVLMAKLQLIFVGHRDFYVGIMISIFTGALIILFFSAVSYSRSKRDVFEELTCLHDKINNYVIHHKCTDIFEQEKEETELKIGMIDVLNKLEHMLKYTKKEKKLMEMIENIVKIAIYDIIVDYKVVLEKIETMERYYYKKKDFDAIQKNRKMMYG